MQGRSPAMAVMRDAAEATAESIHDHLETRVPFKDRNDDLALLVLRVR